MLFDITEYEVHMSIVGLENYRSAWRETIHISDRATHMQYSPELSISPQLHMDALGKRQPYEIKRLLNLWRNGRHLWIEPGSAQSKFGETLIPLSPLLHLNPPAGLPYSVETSKLTSAAPCNDAITRWGGPAVHHEYGTREVRIARNSLWNHCISGLFGARLRSRCGTCERVRAKMCAAIRPVRALLSCVGRILTPRWMG